MPRAEIERDWTCDESGRSNSSPDYLRVVNEVDALLRQGAGWVLRPAWTASTARLIVSNLAHIYGMAPRGPLPPPMKDAE